MVNPNPKPQVGHWVKSETVEATMRFCGLQFEWDPAFPIKKIDFELSLKNNARFGEPILDDKLLEYSGFLENGCHFPGIVVYKPTMMVLGGNHRAKAGLLVGDTTIGVYFVTKADPKKLEEFIWLDNNNHGAVDSDPDEARIARVIYMKMHTGRTLVDACNLMFGRRNMYARVMDRWHQHHAMSSLRANKVSQTKIDRVMATSKASVFSELYSINTENGFGNAKIQKEAFETVYELKLDGVQTNRLCSLVKDAVKDETAQMKAIQDYKDHYLRGINVVEKRQRDSAKTEVLHKVMKHLRSLRGIFSMTPIADLMATPIEVEEVKKLEDDCKQVSKGLKQILEILALSKKGAKNDRVSK